MKRIEIKDFDSVGDNLKDKHNKLMQEESKMNDKIESKSEYEDDDDIDISALNSNIGSGIEISSSELINSPDKEAEILWGAICWSKTKIKTLKIKFSLKIINID